MCDPQDCSAASIKEGLRALEWIYQVRKQAEHQELVDMCDEMQDCPDFVEDKGFLEPLNLRYMFLAAPEIVRQEHARFVREQGTEEA